MYASKSQNSNVSSAMQQLNYIGSSNTNQSRSSSISPLLPPTFTMTARHYSVQQRPLSVAPYQQCPPEYSSYASCYSPLPLPYPSYQNFQPLNGYMYPPISYGPPHHMVAHPNEFINRHRFSNPRHCQALPIKTMPFHCESCDRGFTAMEKYDQHIAEHITCDRDGCTFTAHPMIVEKHVSMQHNTGLFKRIIKGNDPVEIDNWIKDRKKQYPTSKRIEEKQQQREAMDKRGERYINEDKKKTLHNCGPARRNHTNRNGDRLVSVRQPNKHNRGSRRNEKRESCYASGSQKHDNVEPSEDDDFQRNLPRFLGTAHFDDSIILERISSAHNILDSPLRDASSIELAHSQNFFFDKVDINSSDDNDDADSFAKCTEAANFSQKESPEVKISNNRGPNLALVNKSSSLNLIRCYDTSESDDDKEDFSKINNENIAAEHTEVEFEEKNVGQAMIEHINDECKKVNVEISVVIDNDGEHEETNVEIETIEDDNSGPEEQPSKVSKQVEPDTKISNKNFSNGEKKQAKKRKRRKDEKKEDPQALASNSAELHMYKRHRKPTILEKLLAPEIRHERNVILQCVRYVVEKNFFGLDDL